MTKNPLTAVLLLSCPDRIGLVAEFSGFISKNGGNILSLNEYVDTVSNTFFLRVAWDLDNYKISGSGVEEDFLPLFDKLKANWQIHFPEQKERVAIFVSRYDHCLREILWRYSMNEYIMEVAMIISNHEDMRSVAERYSIPYYCFPVTGENKQDVEIRELEVLKDNNINSIILARYMQILSPCFVSEYKNRIINIHHSFLPAFAGSNPYRQAFDRGVKIIGATSHYVTNELDEGPIIEQDITRISHKDTIQDILRKGRDLERIVLARAVKYHVEHRILVHGNKTVVFD